MHVYTWVCLKSDRISHSQLKHLDYLINGRITHACIRSIRLDSDLHFAQARDFFPGPWAGNRRTAAALPFLLNHRKQAHHCASSLCNYHVHHIRNVQRCSFVLLYAIFLEGRGRVCCCWWKWGQPELALLPLVEMGTAPPIEPCMTCFGQ